MTECASTLKYVPNALIHYAKGGILGSVNASQKNIKFGMTQISNTLPSGVALQNMKEQIYAWAENVLLSHETAGRTLSSDELIWATARGVRHPNSVRIVTTPMLSFPADPEIQLFGKHLGLINDRIAALTLGPMPLS